MDSAKEIVSTILEDQQGLLNSELMNEVFAIKCSNASRPSSGVQAGLRHRLPNSFAESDIVTEDPQKKCLLGDRVDGATKGDLKPQDGLAKCMEKFLSACRSNMNTLLRRKPRRAAKSTKLVTPPKITQSRKQAAFEGEDSTSLSCLGQGCWTCLRKRLSSMVKIEEEVVSKRHRSTLYYA